MALPQVPEGFLDLGSAFATETKPYNVIAVCTDVLPATQTRGTDYTIKLTLRDPRWSSGLGMTVRLFHKQLNQLPPITTPGDVLIFRNLKNMINNGSRFGVSSPLTSWVLLSSASVQESTCSKASDMEATRSGTGLGLAPLPRPSELLYAKAILESEDPTTWANPAPSTQLEVTNIMKENGGTPVLPVQKFRLVRDIPPPIHDRSHVFVEILGEVRRVFSNDFRVELSVTDYTTNQLLYDYLDKNFNTGYDGDRFHYIDDGSNQWPGPWGQMTIIVVLWDQNSLYARSEVKAGSFVYLRNVHIKFDKHGSKLEGHCRGDRYSSRVNVSVFKPREAEGDQNFKNLLIRKREYEQKARRERLPFVRDPQEKAKSIQENEDVEKGAKSKRNTNKKERRKAMRKAALRNKEQQSETENQETSAVGEQGQYVLSNVNVKCNNVEIPLKSIQDILDRETLRRTTSRGTPFYLPFQNCRYKTKVRVIDFFPDDVADFTVPYRRSQYDVLSDEDSELEPDVDMTQEQDDGLRWKWRFFLLVEDARPQPYSTNKERARMELLVADSDGDYLLRMEACNLRDPKNRHKLDKLKELRLFHLWGNLQELKDEAGSQEPTSSLRPQAKPFECLIKEYGVLPEGIKRSVESCSRYERMFRLFGTSI